ncbi:MAG: MoaD/ThiS family protein [Anaerolineae bacterium]
MSEIAIEVKLFAGAREVAGAGCVPQRLPAGSTVGDAAKALFADYPALREMRLRFAVNAAYAAEDRVLHDGDELACIPPVGGG